jgi:8-oxo-dGTP diphosphatase
MEKYNFRVIQKAIITYKGKILVIQRATDDDANPGIWDLPGGKIEHNEDPKDGLLREIFEETGLNVTNLRAAFTTSFNFKDIYAYGVVYFAESSSDEIHLSAEHKDHRWIEKENLKNTDVQIWIKECLLKNGFII